MLRRTALVSSSGPGRRARTALLIVASALAAGRGAVAQGSAAAGATPLGTLPPGITDGYAATLRGESFGYHSAHPTARASLLVRSLDSTNAARWTTAPVVASGDAPRQVSFLAAMDVADPGQSPVRFWVTVNGAHRFALAQPTTDADTWSVRGSDGVALRFRRLLTDKFGDVHGVFTLDLPAGIAPVGQPVTLQVQGESVGRMSWFILYTVSMQPTVSAHAEQMLTREDGGLRQTVRLDAWHPFHATTMAIAVDGSFRVSARLEAGRATVRVNVPAVTTPTTVRIVATTATARADLGAVPIEPVVPREVHLINHSHLDIGYTDVHARVLDKHWRGLDSAMVYSERSRANPDWGRFRWNVEGLWPLEGYLATRPAADTARLLAAVRNGDLTLNALYANLMTGLSGSEELLRLTEYARRLRREHGLAITTATSSDVPGFTWGMVPALAQAGIRYVSSGPNYMPGPSYDGDRIGHTLAAWGDRPFWWMGPSGRDSVLVMVAGRGYSWAGGWPSGRISLDDANLMSEYMETLRSRGYPYEIVQVRVSIGGDNGFPDGRLADVVRQWNERFVSPRLVISSLPQLFATMERRYGATLPRLRGDLTGYWEDGAMSTAAEQVMTRASAARIVQAGTLASLRAVPLSSRDVSAAWRSVLLWSEHTWGADRSISEPDSPETLAQWALKRQFALDADSASRALLSRASGAGEAGSAGEASSARAAGGAAKARTDGGDGATTPGVGVDLWNTHEFTVRGVTLVPPSLQLQGALVTASGAPVWSQRLRDGSVAVLVPLAAMGATRLSAPRAGASSSGATPPPPLADPTARPQPPRRAHEAATPARADGDSLWNGRVVVRIDSVSGAVASVRWRGRELVDRARGGWNRYRYVAGRDTSAARDAARPRLDVLDDGPLVATLRVTSDAPGAESLVRDVTLHAGDDAVRVVTRIDKRLVRDKEAVHLAFPLAVPGGVVRMEQGLAIVRPDVDQVDGANRNVYPVQRWLDASNADFGVTLVTPDLPLWQLNGLTAEAFKQPDGREAWLRRALPGTELVAYAMNNYWHTNFKADQPGPVTFRVTLVAHGPFDAAEATRAGLQASEPPLALPASAATTRLRFTLDNPRVIVSSIVPAADSRADLVRLWNPTHEPQRVALRFGDRGQRRIWRSSPDEERGPLAPTHVALPAMGSVTLRIERR